ncbi:pVII protein [Simian adenovirus ER]|nr:pVII protein [Simian adenovirus ER]
MSILISPSNNTGWGLGVTKMYGGAKRRSPQHPVRVRGHFRAPWGSHTRGRTGRTTVDDVIDSVVADARNYQPARSTVDEVIDGVVADARAYARRKSSFRRRRSLKRPTAAMKAARSLLRRARIVGRRAARRAAANAAAGRVRRRAAQQAAAAISSLATPRRGNVYWVRDSATGVRVPVRTRPPRP